MKKRQLKGIIILVLGVLGVFLFFHFKHRPKTIAIKNLSVAVEAELVRAASFPVQVQAIGTLVAAQQSQIISDIPGQVAKIFFKDGSFVKKGAPLIQLNDEVSRARLASAKANLIYSEADYRRKKLLVKRGAISQQAVDQAYADLKEKKALAEEMEVKVMKMQITAPFDGVLGKANINVGDFVNPGQNLVLLTDINHLRAEYSLPERYLSQIKLGQSIHLVTNAYTQKFNGEVTFISPTINSAEHTIGLYASVSNDLHLLTPGLFVNITQQLGEAKNALVISAASLVPTIEGHRVFKIIDNKVISVPIKLGQWSDDSVEIVSGLALGDRVVVAGQQRLKDGSLVRVSIS